MCITGKTKFKRTHMDHFMNRAVLIVSYLKWTLVIIIFFFGGGGGGGNVAGY